MPEDIGNAVGRIIIDTTSLDQAVARVQQASSQIMAILSATSSVLKSNSDQSMQAAAALATAQAQIIKAQAAQTAADAKMVTATTKAESEKRIAQMKAEEKAADDLNKKRNASGMGGIASASDTRDVLKSADQVLARNRRTTDTDISTQVSEYEKGLAAFKAAEDAKVAAQEKAANAMIAAADKVVAANQKSTDAEMSAAESEVNAQIEAADRVIEAHRKVIQVYEQELAAQEKLTANALSSADKVLAQHRKTTDTDISSSVNDYQDQARQRMLSSAKRGVDNYNQARAAEAARQSQADTQIALPTGGRMNVALDPQMAASAAQFQAISSQRSKAIDQAQADATRLNKALDDARANASKGINIEVKSNIAAAQSAITAASAQFAQLENQFKQLQAIAPPDINLDPLREQLAASKQPIIDLQAQLQTLKSDLHDIDPNDTAGLGQFNKELVEMRNNAQQVASTGLDPLRQGLQSVDQEVTTATTGIRGYFNQLREGLQEVNRQGLGKNIQELGFRLAPAGLAAGAAISQGLQTEQSLEETKLSFESIAGSEQKALDLMNELTKEAQKFGLPVTQTLVTFQQYYPVLQKTGHSFTEFIDLAARLATLNPVQGVEGGLRAISEAVTGSGSNFVSLANRFNIPLKALQAMRDKTGDVVSGLSELLDSYGRTSELAEKFGNTSRAAMQRAEDAWNKFLAEAVAPLLAVLTPVLKMITSILTSINNSNSIIPGVIGIFMGLTAAIVSVTFALGNLIIAWEALSKLKAGGVLANLLGGGAGSMAATGGAQVAAGLIPGSAEAFLAGGAGAAATGGAAASTAGLTAAVGGLAAGVASILPILAVATVAVGAIAIVMDGVQQASRAAIDKSLEPLRDKLQEIADIGEKSSDVKIPEPVDVGATFDKYASVDAVIRKMLDDQKAAMDHIQQLKTVDMTKPVVDLASKFFESDILGQKITPDTFRNIAERVLPDGGLGPVWEQVIEKMIGERDIAGLVKMLPQLPKPLFEELANRLGTPEQAAQLMAFYNATGTASDAVQETMDKLKAAQTANMGNLIKTALGSFNDFITQAPELIKAFHDTFDQLAKMRDAYNLTTSRTDEDRGIRDAREMFDYIANRSKEVADFERQLGQESEDYNRERAAKIDDFNRSLEKMDEDAADQRKKLEDDYNKQSERAQQQHLKAMLRASHEVDDAISARDFLSAQKALQKMKDEEQDFSDEQKQKKEDYDQQQKDLNDNLEKQKKERQDDFARQLKDMDDNFARSRQREQADFVRRLQEEDQQRALTLQRQREDDRLQDTRRKEDYQLQVNELISHNALMAFLQANGLQQLEDGFKSFFQGVAAVQASSTAAPQIGPQQGGTVVPTTFTSNPVFTSGAGASVESSLNDFYAQYQRNARGFAVGAVNLQKDMFANLHKGETILTQPISQALLNGDITISGRSGGSNGSLVFSPQISVTINGTDLDIDELRNEFEIGVVDKMHEEFERVAARMGKN